MTFSSWKIVGICGIGLRGTNAPGPSSAPVSHPLSAVFNCLKHFFQTVTYRDAVMWFIGEDTIWENLWRSVHMSRHVYWFGASVGTVLSVNIKFIILKSFASIENEIEFDERSNRCCYSCVFMRQKRLRLNRVFTSNILGGNIKI